MEHPAGHTWLTTEAQTALDNAMRKAGSLYEMCGSPTVIHAHAKHEPCEGHDHWNVPPLAADPKEQ